MNRQNNIILKTGYNGCKELGSNGILSISYKDSFGGRFLEGFSFRSISCGLSSMLLGKWKLKKSTRKSVKMVLAIPVFGYDIRNRTFFFSRDFHHWYTKRTVEVVEKTFREFVKRMKPLSENATETGGQSYFTTPSILSRLLVKNRLLVNKINKIASKQIKAGTDALQEAGQIRGRVSSFRTDVVHIYSNTIASKQIKAGTEAFQEAGRIRGRISSFRTGAVHIYSNTIASKQIKAGTDALQEVGGITGRFSSSGTNTAHINSNFIRLFTTRRRDSNGIRKQSSGYSVDRKILPLPFRIPSSSALVNRITKNLTIKTLGKTISVKGSNRVERNFTEGYITAGTSVTHSIGRWQPPLPAVVDGFSSITSYRSNMTLDSYPRQKNILDYRQSLAVLRSPVLSHDDRDIKKAFRLLPSFSKNMEMRKIISSPLKREMIGNIGRLHSSRIRTLHRFTNDLKVNLRMVRYKRTNVSMLHAKRELSTVEMHKNIIPGKHTVLFSAERPNLLYTGLPQQLSGNNKSTTDSVDNPKSRDVRTISDRRLTNKPRGIAENPMDSVPFNGHRIDEIADRVINIMEEKYRMEAKRRGLI